MLYHDVTSKSATPWIVAASAALGVIVLADLLLVCTARRTQGARVAGPGGGASGDASLLLRGSHSRTWLPFFLESGSGESRWDGDARGGGSGDGGGGAADGGGGGSELYGTHVGGAADTGGGFSWVGGDGGGGNSGGGDGSRGD